MNRTYNYPRFNRFVVIFAIGVVLLFAMVAKAYFEESWRTTNLISRVVAIFVGLFFTGGSILVLTMEIVSLLGLKKVITDGESLTILNPFSKIIIAWKDITEFGTYTAGYNPRVRVFYVKRKGFNDRKISVCAHQLKNLKTLIDTIFLMAVNAKFVMIENVAWLPFTKQLQVFTWDRSDQSFI